MYFFFFYSPDISHRTDLLSIDGGFASGQRTSASYYGYRLPGYGSDYAVCVQTVLPLKGDYGVARGVAEYPVDIAERVQFACQFLLQIAYIYVSVALPDGGTRRQYEQRAPSVLPRYAVCGQTV